MKCKRCILDSSIPGITFDKNSYCNHCKHYDEKSAKYPQNPEILKNILKKIKEESKDNQYDCIVGVSGGVDSTYTLYKIIKYGLNPLVVHIDNGWDTDISKENMKNLADKLNLSIKNIFIDSVEFRDLQKAFLKASVPDAEVLTDIGMKAIIYEEAVKNNLKYIISGGNLRTEGMIPREWGCQDGRFIKDVNKKFGKNSNLKKFKNLSLFNIIYYNIFKKIKIIRPLNYLDYNKQEIKKFIKKELDWKDYGGKHYESIYTRFVSSYWCYEKFGIDKRIIEYSALIRSGQMTKEDARNKLMERPFPKEKAERDIKVVLDKLDFTKDEFNEIFNRPNKNYKDYKTYYYWLNIFRPIVKFIINSTS